MNILGIGNSTNSNVTLIVNDKIVYAAQEERFARVKQIKTYPLKAIEDCLRFARLNYDDINYVVCGGWKNTDLDVLEDYFESVKNGYPSDTAAKKMFWSMERDFAYREDFYINSARLFKNATIKVFEHHYAHACSAFYPSSFEEFYILTADGRGDGQSVVFWKADRQNGLQKIKTFCELKSLGALYGQITGVLGFKPDRHEGKITGLAAYGKESPFLEFLNGIFYEKDGEIVVSAEFVPFLSYDYSSIKQFIDDNGCSKEDVAYAVQNVLECVIVALVKKYVPSGSNLCMAGGVFGNVKLNQRIREQCLLQNYYVFPEMGDGGMGFGAAIAMAKELGINDIKFENAFLGPKYEWDCVDLDKYDVIKCESVYLCAKKASELIIDGKVAGVFTGRMEYGPRALGARSIMLDATNADVNAVMNKRLNRTEFMPFAPVTLLDEVEKMYVDFDRKDVNAEYMTTCYVCTDVMAKMSPAVVHVDNTARPQVISQSYPNVLYYEILKTYYDKTGIPSLVNTSFNNHEEPIVCTPLDALDSLDKDNIDFVVTDCMIISKK